MHHAAGINIMKLVGVPLYDLTSIGMALHGTFAGNHATATVCARPSVNLVFNTAEASNQAGL